MESEPCSGIAESILEVEQCGLPCGVQLSAGKHPGVEDEAGRLGFATRTPMPGMTLSPGDLADVRALGLDVVRVENEEDLEGAARVAAVGSGAPLEFMLPLYAPALLQLAGFAVYVGRVGGEMVTTAMGYQVDDEVAIFSVATSPAHRRRGYGSVVTARAARAGFDGGADLAWPAAGGRVGRPARDRGRRPGGRAAAAASL